MPIFRISEKEEHRESTLNTQYSTAVLHCKAVMLRPKMNRFVQGYRISAQQLSIAFVAKKAMVITAALMMMSFNEDDNIDAIRPHSK